MPTRVVFRPPLPFLVSLLACLPLVLLVPPALAQPGCGIEGVAADPPTFGSCQQCHSQNPINSGDGALLLNGLPDRWLPGTSYRLTAVLQDPGQRLWGLRLTAIDRQGNLAGALQPADGNSSLCSVSGRTYLRQTGPGRRAGVEDGPIAWEFDWTTPPAAAARASFYAVGIACDFDGTESGDFTYSTATSVLEDGGTGPAATITLQPDRPSVTAGSTLVVRATIKNQTAAPISVLLGSRARLPSGRVIPTSGSLLEPVAVDLGPFEQQQHVLVHPVPAGLAMASAEYIGVVGALSHTVIDRDSFEVTVTQ